MVEPTDIEPLHRFQVTFPRELERRFWLYKAEQYGVDERVDVAIIRKAMDKFLKEEGY